MVVWYREIFDEDYLRVYGPLFKPERTAKEVEFLLGVLALKPGASILDLCCGYGRHSIELARKGFQVTGYDLSEHLLGAAKQAARESGVNVKWVHGDMRDLPLVMVAERG